MHPETLPDRKRPEASSDGPARESRPEPAGEAHSVLERMLERPANIDAGGGVPGEATVSAWSGRAGVLGGGTAAHLAASCLIRPAPGDRVLAWTGADGHCWVLSILHRRDEEAPAVLATAGPMAIETSRLGIVADAVHLVAEDFLTSTRNRHAVERTRTETAQVRVARIGTDIRRATTADDKVDGTLLQQAGTWISSTVREARLRARTFLFD